MTPFQSFALRVYIKLDYEPLGPFVRRTAANAFASTRDECVEASAMVLAIVVASVSMEVSQ